MNRELEIKLEKAMQTIAELTTLVEQLQFENKKLNHQNQELIRRVFGSNSEKFDPNQPNLFELEEAKKPAAVDAGDAPAAKPPRKQRKQQRLKKSMQDLPTTSEVIEPHGIKDSPQDWKRIGEEVREELHFQPARYWRHRIIRPKYARREESIEESNIALAELPPSLLEGSVLTPSLLAGIVSSKYCWHLPLYRQEQIMRFAGLDCNA